MYDTSDNYSYYYRNNNSNDNYGNAKSNYTQEGKNPNKQNGHCHSNAQNIHDTGRKGAGKSSLTGRSREEAILF